MFSRNRSDDDRMTPKVYRNYIVSYNGKRFYETEHHDHANKVMEELRTLYDADHPYKYASCSLAITMNIEYRVIHNGGNSRDAD